MIATFSPTSAFIRVDFPTFGRPTKAANPLRCSVIIARLPAARAASVARASGCRLVFIADAVVGFLFHGEPREPTPSALGPFGAKHQAVGRRARSGDRNLAERLGEQARRGVDIVLVDLDVEEFA